MGREREEQFVLGDSPSKQNILDGGGVVLASAMQFSSSFSDSSLRFTNLL